MKKAIEKQEALEIFAPSLRAPGAETLFDFLLALPDRSPRTELRPHGELVTLDLADFESLSEAQFAELLEHASSVRIVGAF